MTGYGACDSIEYSRSRSKPKACVLVEQRCIEPAVKLPEQVQTKGQELLQRAGHIITQSIKNRNKQHALHAP
jgi:hypothetical protein